MASEENTPSPFAFALNAQREWLDAGTDAVAKTDVLEDRLETIQSVEVGGTPSEVVYEENKLELLHYEPRTDEQHDVPILVVYALINRPFVLDLQPDRSVVRRLLEAGHDVYLIDWNEPSRLDRHLTLDDYVNRYIDNCVDVVRERSGQESINLLGYCMGGTMSVMYTALHGEKVRTLGLMAAGLCFDGTGGVLERWGDDAYYDPEDVTEVFGNVPAEMLDVGFALMDPVSNYVSKYVRLYENLENEAFVENFARMERWLAEGIDLAGDTYVQFLRDVYQDNNLHRNELFLGGEHVDVTSIDVPVLQILGEYDHLIPPESSKPFNDVVGSDDVTTIEYPTGHIGLAVSGSSHEDVWPRVAEWYLEKSTDDPTDPEDREAGVEAATATVVEATDEELAERAAGVEAVDGIGPTYAERLRTAGIDTVVDLAAADSETVAEAADVRETRAEEWSAAARDALDVEEAPIDIEDEEPVSTGPPEEGNAGTADPAGADGSGIEEIDGIGPTYAERLRAAGIETVPDLAGAAVAAVAEAAQVSETRASKWVQQARD